MQAILSIALPLAADPATKICADFERSFSLARSIYDQAGRKLFLEIDGCLSDCLRDIDVHSIAVTRLPWGRVTEEPTLGFLFAKLSLNRRLDLALNALKDLSRRDSVRSQRLLKKLADGIDAVASGLKHLSDWASYDAPTFS